MEIVTQLLHKFDSRMYSLHILLMCVLFKNSECTLMIPVAKTEDGPLQGTYFETFNNRTVYSFLGVPFAEPPIGKLRFKQAIPVSPWTEVKVVNETKEPCLQFNHYLLVTKEEPITGDEDCLYLNIYTPKFLDDDKELMEVIVFIHGGAFTYGSRNGFNPKYLLDKHDFVFITLSYRVGPFGFLSTEDDVVPGNNGLKDQNLALKWINRNVRSFGGDPKKVTLAGLSAGGASVHFHYFSPMSKGLFKKGISLSGTVFCPWAIMKSPKEKALKLATAVDCPTDTSKKLIACLQNRSGRSILSKMQSLFMPWLFNPISPFAPTIENKNNIQPFLSDHPETLLKKGEIHDMPWIVGFTTEEGLYPASEFILNNALLNELNDKWSEIAPHLLDFNFTENVNQHVSKSKKIKEFYFKEKSISNKTVAQIIKMIGDRMFVSAINKAVKLQAVVNKSPVFVYNFAYRGLNSLSEQFYMQKKDLGVSHGDDAAYVLGSYFSCTDNNSDKMMVETMVMIWSNYITKGTPSPVFGVDWHPTHEKDEIKFLMIKSSENISMLTADELGNMKFWNSLNFHSIYMSKHDEL